MSEVGDLLRGIAAAMWVGLAFLVFLMLRGALMERTPFLTKFGLGPSGVSMEFAEQKLDEAASKGVMGSRRDIGKPAKQAVAIRLERNADLMALARILWVDDHPGNNTPLIELFRSYGARVDTARSNDDALALLHESRYDVVISDVGRDNEPPNTELKGVEFAETTFQRWGQKAILATARFDPTRLPEATDRERLELTRRVSDTVFGRTNRLDEVIHLTLDMIERKIERNRV